MTNTYVKNIEHEKVLKLTSLVTAMPGQVVSRTLAQNDAVRLVNSVRPGSL